MIIKEKTEFDHMGQAYLVSCLPTVSTGLAAKLEEVAVVIQDQWCLAKSQGICRLHSGCEDVFINRKVLYK